MVKMGGTVALPSSATLVAVGVVLSLLLNAAMLCNGGKTSTFVRSADPNMDIPVDNPTIYIPPGHNLPQ